MSKDIMLMKLEGKLSPSVTIFPLKNYLGRAAFLKVTIAPEPEGKVLITDVVIGRTSQMACAGAFKAEILNHLPLMSLEAIPSGADITLHLSGNENYDGRVSIDIVPYEKTELPLSVLFPSGGKTNIAGKLVEIVPTSRLLEAIQRGTVEAKIAVRPHVYDHQEALPRSYDVAIRDDRLYPQSAVDLMIGENFEMILSGDEAGEFGWTDYLGIGVWGHHTNSPTMPRGFSTS